MIVRVKFSREALLHDISSEAYVAADVEEGAVGSHALHQTFDICEEGNIDRVDRLISLAFSEAEEILDRLIPARSPRGAIRCLGNDTPYCGSRVLTLALPDNTGERIGRHISHTVHEYLVARVMGLWLSVTLPAKGEAWIEKASELRNLLSEIVAGTERKRGLTVVRRACCPF